MKKRILAILLSAASAISLAGCAGFGGGGSSSSSAPASSAAPSSSAAASAAGSSSAAAEPAGLVTPNGEFPIVTEPYTLTVLVPDAPYISELNENNEFTKWYEEYTGVHVEYTEVAYDSKREKVNLLLASGEYPDIMMWSGINAADEVLYGSQGIFLRLNDLIEEYGLETKKVFDAYAELPGAITTPDGNIYALPNINDCFHCNNTVRAWINQDWLDNLGLATPTTTDEFYEVLKAFKEKDPNGNGKADEIPMMGCNKDGNMLQVWPFLMNSFVYYDGGHIFLDLDNGNVEFIATTDAYREGIRYIHKLFEEGLIDPTSLTQTEEQFKQVGTNPDAQLVGVGTSSFWWKFLGYDRDTADQRANSYTALAPLKGPAGVQYSPTTATAATNGMLVITDKCKNPEVAFRWADALYNEEVTYRSQLGIEGTNYEKAPEGSLGINKKPGLYVKIVPDTQIEERTTDAGNVFMGNRSSDWRLGEVADYSDPATQWAQEPRLYNETNDKYFPYSDTSKKLPASLYLLPEESSDYARLKAQIETYAKESLVAFFTGNKNVETDWDAYVAEFEKLELPKYLELNQTAYDRQYK